MRRVDQLVGVGVGQRGQPGRVIAEHLGGRPAEPEHHERPEHWLLDHADQHFDAAGEHRLHQDPSSGWIRKSAASAR